MDCVTIFLYVVSCLVTGVLTFECTSEFDFYPHEDCHKFYRCIWSKANVFDCPAGTKWNQDVLTCDFEHNVECDKLSSPENTKLSTEKGDLPIAFIHHMLNSSRKKKLGEQTSLSPHIRGDDVDIDPHLDDDEQDFHASAYDHDYDSVNDDDDYLEEDSDTWMNAVAAKDYPGEGDEKVDDEWAYTTTEDGEGNGNNDDWANTITGDYAGRGGNDEWATNIMWENGGDDNGDWANKITGNPEYNEIFNDVDNLNEARVSVKNNMRTETFPRLEKYSPVYSPSSGHSTNTKMTSAVTTIVTTTTTTTAATIPTIQPTTKKIGGEGIEMINHLTKFLEERLKKKSPPISPNNGNDVAIVDSDDNTGRKSIIATSSFDKINRPFLQRFLERLRQRRPGHG